MKELPKMQISPDILTRNYPEHKDIHKNFESFGLNPHSKMKRER